MIDENFILKSWNEQVLIFINNLQVIRIRPTRKTVHDLRVSVKKIRSYLRLRKKITGESWKNKFARVTEIFKVSGKQRDFEISYSLLLKYLRQEKLMMPLFKKFLQTNKSLTHHFTKNAMLDFNDEQFQEFSACTSSSLALLTNSECTDKINMYVNEVIHKADWQSKNTDENAHEIRKKFKDLYYWLMVCTPNPAKSLMEIKQLEKPLKYLGDWQDNFIFHGKLKKFRKEFLVSNSIEAEAANLLVEKIKVTKNELLEKTKNKLSAVIKK